MPTSLTNGSGNHDGGPPGPVSDDSESGLKSHHESPLPAQGNGGPIRHDSGWLRIEQHAYAEPAVATLARATTGRLSLPQEDANSVGLCHHDTPRALFPTQQRHSPSPARRKHASLGTLGITTASNTRGCAQVLHSMSHGPCALASTYTSEAGACQPVAGAAASLRARLV